MYIKIQIEVQKRAVNTEKIVAHVVQDKVAHEEEKPRVNPEYKIKLCMIIIY
jgi:hypothetical protein